MEDTSTGAAFVHLAGMLSLEGAVLLPRDDVNRAFYAQPAQVAQRAKMAQRAQRAQIVAQRAQISAQKADKDQAAQRSEFADPVEMAGKLGSGEEESPTARALLAGRVPPPAAAAPLYRALVDAFEGDPGVAALAEALAVE